MALKGGRVAYCPIEGRCLRPVLRVCVVLSSLLGPRIFRIFCLKSDSEVRLRECIIQDTPIIAIPYNILNNKHDTGWAKGAFAVSASVRFLGQTTKGKTWPAAAARRGRAGRAAAGAGGGPRGGRARLNTVTRVCICAAVLVWITQPRYFLRTLTAERARAHVQSLT